MTDTLAGLAARDDLLHVARRWAELRRRLHPTGGKAEGSRPAPASRPPIDVGISDLLREVEEHARFLGQVLLDEVDPAHGCGGVCHGSPDHTCGCEPESAVVLGADCPDRRDPVTTSAMPGLLKEVAARWGHFAGPDCDERLALDFCDEAHELARRVDGALGDRERPEYIGPCPTAECDGELFLRRDRVDGTCRECGAVFDRGTQAEFLARQFDGRLMTVAELRAALVTAGVPVPRATLYRWVSQGRITSEDGELYRFAEAYRLACQRVETRGSAA